MVTKIYQVTHHLHSPFSTHTKEPKITLKFIYLFIYFLAMSTLSPQDAIHQN